MEAINRILEPKQPKTNTDTSLLKIVAMITMLIDHSGKMLFPDYPVMRMIGRIAFPIYAYCLAVGVVYTRHPLRYLSRMVLLGLVSQPLYALAMGHANNAMYAVSFTDHPLRAAVTFYVNSWQEPSILFALVCGLILLWAIRNRQFPIAIAMYLFCYLARDRLDYGMNGIHLMMLFYLLCEHPLISAACTASFMTWWGMRGWGYQLFGMNINMQLFAVAALPLIYISTNTGIKLPKWLFYLFYPAHLALILFLNVNA